VWGQIDRLDIEHDTDQDTRYVVIDDYKTGLMPPIREIQEGISLFIQS
jgi:hypothetical protein